MSFAIKGADMQFFEELRKAQATINSDHLRVGGEAEKMLILDALAPEAAEYWKSLNFPDDLLIRPEDSIRMYASMFDIEIKEEI